MAADVVLRALKHVWTSLEPLNVPMALMGGLALAAWKHVRATRDVDLLVSLGDQSPELIIQSLEQAGLRTKRQPPVQQLGPSRLVQLLYAPPSSLLDLQVDLLLADSEYQRAALDRRVPVQLPGVDIEIFVLACEDLILHKLAAGRVVDRVDAAALLRANRLALDMTYLQSWLRRVATASDWAEVWREAFPGEPSTPP